MDTADASTMSTTGWCQPAVGWNEWKSLSAPELGAWTPDLRVAVIIPARNDQAGLDLTLASLAAQTYPSDLLQVIVVDDASDSQLMLPARCPERSEVLRLDPGPTFGAGRARREGARVATEADVLLFADADIVLHRRHVEAHARWHHVIDYAVTMGYRRFVSFDGLDVEQVTDAVRDDRMEALLGGRQSVGHEWLESIIDRTDGLTERDADPFRVAVGANVGVRRGLYEAAGGYAAFGRRGIEDTETGYRLQVAGAVFIPEPAARSWHQGARSMAGEGAAEIVRQRRWLLEHHIPIKQYRKGRRGRQYVVPTLQVVVDADGQSAEAVTETVDCLLTSDFTDLHVTIVAESTLRDRSLLADAYDHDSRVTLSEKRPSPFPSPYELRLLAGYRMTPSSVDRILTELRRRQVGALRLISPTPLDPATMPTLWRTDARRRAELVSGPVADIEPAIGALFGEWWVDSTELGVFDGHHPQPVHPEVESRPSGRDGRTSQSDVQLQQLERLVHEREEEIARLRRRRALRWADQVGRLLRRISSPWRKA